MLSHRERAAHEFVRVYTVTFQKRQESPDLSGVGLAGEKLFENALGVSRREVSSLGEFGESWLDE